LNAPQAMAANRRPSHCIRSKLHRSRITRPS